MWTSEKPRPPMKAWTDDSRILQGYWRVVSHQLIPPAPSPHLASIHKLQQPPHRSINVRWHHGLERRGSLRITACHLYGCCISLCASLYIWNQAGDCAATRGLLELGIISSDCNLLPVVSVSLEDMGDKFRKAQRAEGPATVLAIGTANPPGVLEQSTYPDFYFDITNSNDKTALKEKFKRMCDKSGIRKRHMYLTEEILKENPNITAYMAPSLDARQDIVVTEVPKLGKEAAAKAIKEWGQPKSKITHLIFCTTSGVDMPGADYALTKLLGLRPSVKRVMLYQQGCFAGGTVLRVAKDLAENNKNARVLAVCSEITAVTFRGPSETHLDSLVGQALFSDGAAAIIVGADPVPEVESPQFELWWNAQTILPDSDGAIDGHLREVGLTFHLLKDVPGLISKNVEKCLTEAFEQFGVSSWNDLFWIAHPGGPAILDQVEAKLQLDPKKMHPSRHILSEYGNMSSACVLFIMDYMRTESKERGCSTTGQGLEWGVLFGFGPGLTVETVVLRSVPIEPHRD